MKKMAIGIALIALFMCVLTFGVSAEGRAFGEDKNLFWELNSETGELKITGSGEMEFEYLVSSPYIPWKYEKESIKAVIISEGVTSIDYEAFEDCDNLEKVYIGKDVREIQSYAFAYCEKLKEVNMPETLEVFETSIFCGCESLEDITIPYGVTELEDTFAGCTNLKSVTLPNSIEAFDYWTFMDCDNLTDIYYEGTTEQWKDISYYYKAEDYAENVTIHYEHKHEYYEISRSMASVTEDGAINYACLNCGHSKSDIIYIIDSVSLSSSTYTYNKKVKTPEVVIKDAKGYTLVENIDYTLSYDEGRINIGNYSVDITFCGDYFGEETLSFTIIPKAPSISSIKYKDGGKATVNWSKIEIAKGYQLQYATNYEFKKAKEFKFTKNTTLTKNLTSISSNKMWYMRIRAYKTVAGKTYYSNWSATKCVAVSANKAIKFKYPDIEASASKNEKVASIITDTIYPESIGNTTITLTTTDGEKVVCNLYVTACDFSIFKGDSRTLPKYNNSTKLTWKSKNTAIATANKQTVKGVKQGHVKFTSKKANVTYTINVHVVDYKAIDNMIYDEMYYSLKNPDSLKVYGKWKGYDKNGYPTVVWDYGATNSFGGMVRDYYIVRYVYDSGQAKYPSGTYKLFPSLTKCVKMK